LRQIKEYGEEGRPIIYMEDGMQEAVVAYFEVLSQHLSTGIS
jgi:hypothetical protein